MKKNTIIAISIMMLTFGMVGTAEAGTLDSLQLKVRAGYNIGGTAPLPLPESIRSIDSYSLTPSFMVGFDAALPLKGPWGIAAGVHFENKGMKGDVTTKSYYMELVKGDSKVSGLFTGHVQQKVTLKGGPYLSVLLSKDFSGIASDGYLREGSPVGAKIMMGNKEGEWATYELDDDMRSMQFGIGIGADWQVYKGLGVSADLNWGLTGIFPGDYKTVEQTLYPIYGTIGIFYRLK